VVQEPDGAEVGVDELFEDLVGRGFMPHGHCYFWTPSLVWLQVLTNLSIGLAYLAISVTLVVIVRRIQDLPFKWMFRAFGVFIVTCGFTHFLDVWTIWTPVYWLDGGVRAITAVASLGTAVLLVPLVPKAVALAGAAKLAHDRGLALEEVNRKLALLYERGRETLAEAVPAIVWSATADGRLDDVNRRWTETTGQSREQALRDGMLGLVHPDDREPVAAAWRAALAARAPYEVTLRLRAADGSWRWHTARARPLLDGDRVVKWFGSTFDVDEERRTAAAREALLARTQEAVHGRDVFLTVAAHELRTPVAALRMRVEGLLRDASLGRSERLAGPVLVEKLGLAARQTARLDALANTLLDVARAATGQLELEVAPYDLAAVVREVVEDLRPEAEAAGSPVVVEAPAQLPARGDALRVGQMVRNLLANALKYGGGEPVSLQLRDDGAHAVLAVRDRGPGIAAVDRERVFQPFERGVSARHFGGLGLGLWIVRVIAERMGGGVRLDSEVGQGSTFVLELPRHLEAGHV
jgi:hypothetical protein